MMKIVPRVLEKYSKMYDAKKCLIIYKWILLGELPLMTKRGHFIINGIPRIIINQIIRSPGIYYQQESHKFFKNNKPYIYRTFFADIISKRGVWLRLELDKKRRSWIYMKKTPKIPLFLFLKNLGISNKTLVISSFTQQADHNQLNNFRNDVNFSLFATKFLNNDNYNLGRIGRQQINSKLGLNLKQTTLTSIDFLKMTLYLYNLNQNPKQVDDIDDLTNRRLRTVDELLRLQFQQAIYRLEKILIDQIKKVRSKNLLFPTKPFNTTLREFFGSCQLSQFLDQTNPLAELTHKRRISSMGPNGIQRDSAGMEIRGIHPTYFGRICPIETPEGQNAGLVNSLTVLSRKNKEGFLESAFCRVYKGQILNHLLPFYQTSNHEYNQYIILPDYRLSSLNFLTTRSMAVRYQQNIMRIARTQIQYCLYSPLQIISVATSIIPFLEHNDANRVLMGSNMQRQAVPLLIGESSIIRTNPEKRIISDIGYCRQTSKSGLIIYSSKLNIDLYKSLTYTNFQNKKYLLWIFFKIQNRYFHNLSLHFRIFNQIPDYPLKAQKSVFYGNRANRIVYKIYKLSSRKLQFWSVLKKTYFKQITSTNWAFFDQLATPIPQQFQYRLNKINPLKIPNTFQKSTFWLKNFEKTNQNTYLIQKPIVSFLDWVQKGDLLTDCSSSKKGQLALGKNLLLAYLPWCGFNFEDALILNEQIVFGDHFTSLHIEKYEIELQNHTENLEKITANLPNKDPSKELLDCNGIIQIGCAVKEGTILVGKVTPLETRPLLPHEKLLYDIVGKQYQQLKDTCDSFTTQYISSALIVDNLFRFRCLS